VIPQRSYSETHSLETAGMSSSSLSLFLIQTFPLLVSPSFLYVFLTFLLSILGMCEQSPRALSPPVPSLPCTLVRRERADPGIMHTDMTICHREARAHNGSDACGKTGKQRGVVRHPRFSLPPAPSHPHWLSHINTYTGPCCHDSRFSLIWAWCLSHAETVH